MSRFRRRFYVRYACRKCMARVASPTCALCGERKMKRIYVRSGSTFVGAGWACGCDSRSSGIEEDSKGWGIIAHNAQ